jgi:hypothetical protein
MNAFAWSELVKLNVRAAADRSCGHNKLGDCKLDVPSGGLHISVRRFTCYSLKSAH